MEYHDDLQKVKRILLVAYYFSPSDAVGARRALALYNHLFSAGYSVDVLSNNWNGKQIPSVNYIGKRSVQVNKGRSGGKNSFKIAQYFRSLDKTIFSSFFFNVLRRVFLARGDCEDHYDLVISSYKPSCNVLLGIVLSRIYKAKLIVEMRDLISIFGRKKYLPVFDELDRWIDRFMIGFASTVVTVSPSSRKKAEKFYRRPIELVFNGIDMPEFNPNPLDTMLTTSSRKTVIFYSGLLSSARTLNRICSFIRKAGKSDDIRIVVASHNDPMEYGGDPKFVEWLGYLPRNEIQKRQAGANYLLLLEGSGSDSIENIPAKLYEYLLALRPVLADCHPKSDSVSILEKTNTGCAIDTFDKFINAIETNWFDPNANLAMYHRGYQNGKYLELIDDLLSELNYPSSIPSQGTGG